QDRVARPSRYDAGSHRIGRDAARAPCGSDRPRKRAVVELVVPRVETGWPPRDLRRCAPRQGGAVAEGQQDRRQRRPRAGADHARRLVPRGDGEGPRLPSRACTAGSTRTDRVADYDAEELCGRNLEEIRPGVTQSLPRPFPAAGPPAVRGPPVLPTNN